MGHDGDGDANCRWCIWNNPQRTGKTKTGRTGNRQVETFQTAELLKSARIIRRALET